MNVRIIIKELTKSFISGFVVVINIVEEFFSFLKPFFKGRFTH